MSTTLFTQSQIVSTCVHSVLIKHDQSDVGLLFRCDTLSMISPLKHKSVNVELRSVCHIGYLGFNTNFRLIYSFHICVATRVNKGQRNINFITCTCQCQTSAPCPNFISAWTLCTRALSVCAVKRMLLLRRGCVVSWIPLWWNTTTFKGTDIYAVLKLYSRLKDKIHCLSFRVTHRGVFWSEALSAESHHLVPPHATLHYWNVNVVTNLHVISYFFVYLFRFVKIMAVNLMC